MTKLDLHYATSTGALHTTVMFAEISLRVALQSEFTDNKHYLRREMEEVLEMLQKALAEHRARDNEVNKSIWTRGDAA
jgi:hypothetical protein